MEKENNPCEEMFRIPHQTLLERLARPSLFKELKKEKSVNENIEILKNKWIGLFNEEEFKIIFQNIVLRIGDNTVLTDRGKIVMLAGSFENFFIIREYLDKFRNDSSKRWYKKTLETYEDMRSFLKYAEEKLGKKIMKDFDMFSNMDYRDHKK